jgi:hypothetical protein
MDIVIAKWRRAGTLLFDQTFYGRVAKDKNHNNFDAYNTAIIDYLRNASSMLDVVLVL